MWKQAKPVVLLSLAFIFISLGILGLFLPFLQGILFILIGVTILALVSPKFKLKLYYHLTPHIRTKAKVEALFTKLEKIFGQHKAD